jgi:2-dehydro-3-deoxygalactonokinase
MTRWIALGLLGSEYVAYSLEGGVITGRAQGVSETKALGDLPFEADQVVRIGEGTPETVPCAVLPENGAALPVITQDNPPDVLDAWLRLWIAGYLAGHKNWDGVIWAIEADASHWIHVSADEIISFTSFLTPRLRAALNGADKPAIEAIADTMSRPERLASHLRQAELGRDPRAITGHLLGAELAAARPYWLGQQVALITPDGDASGYAAALESQGVPVDVMQADKALAIGLKALRSTLKPLP